MENSTPEPEPIVVPRKNAKQSRVMGEYITESGVLLTIALTNPEIAAILATRSYDSAKLGVGIALQNAAQMSYNSRQNALGGREESVEEQTHMFEEERAEFLAFRELAKPFFPDKGDRTSLNLSGTLPREMGDFVSFLRAGYTNAKGAKFQAILAPLGFDIAKLDAELAELQTFEEHMSDRQVAGGAAKNTTGDRNGAFRALKTYMDQLEGVAKANLGVLISKMPFEDLPNVSLPKI